MLRRVEREREKAGNLERSMARQLELVHANGQRTRAALSDIHDLQAEIAQLKLHEKREETQIVLPLPLTQEQPGEKEEVARAALRKLKAEYETELKAQVRERAEVEARTVNARARLKELLSVSEHDITRE